jgi:lysozyme
MLDLSNNNSLSWLPTAYNFEKAFAAGHRRIYFKATEGMNYIDPRTPALAKKAVKAGFKVGWYHFANSWNASPEAQADFFLRTIPSGAHLIPCLDMEQGVPSSYKGSFARRFIQHIETKTQNQVLVYGSTYYLQECFKGSTCPGPLWLAAVARNGGPLDYKWAKIPSPWKPTDVASHQFRWDGKVPGIPGKVDISRPINVSLMDAK